MLDQVHRSHPALHGALDHLFGGRAASASRSAAGCRAATWMNSSTKAISRMTRPAGIADLRNPHRDRRSRPATSRGSARNRRSSAGRRRQAKKPMKPMPMTRQTISIQCRLRSGSLSISRPTRIISPLRKVWARPRNAIAAMHQETKSSAGRNVEADRPPGRQHHHQHEDRHHEHAGEIAREKVETIKKNPHDAPVPMINSNDGV